MADRTVTVISTNLLTSLGGTVSAGDSVFIDRYSIDYVAGTDRSAADLILVMIGPEFGGTFDGAGALVLVCDQTSTGKFINNGGGKIVRVRSSSGAGVIWQIEIGPTGGSCQTHVDTCTTTNLVGTAGENFLHTAFTGTTGFIYGGNFTHDESGVAMTTLNIWGGKWDEYCDITTVNLYNGEFNAMIVTVSPTTVNQHGGKFGCRNIGNIGTYNGNAGVWDLRGLSHKITVTTANLAPGLTILKDKNTDRLLTITTTNTLYGPPKIIYS